MHIDFEMFEIDKSYETKGNVIGRKITCLLPLFHQVMHKFNFCSDPVPLLPLRRPPCRSRTEGCRDAATAEQHHNTLPFLWKSGTKMGQSGYSTAKHDTQVTAHFEESGDSRYVSGCLNITFLVRRYFLQFHAVKGYTPGYMGVDDFSMSPECFGLGKLRIVLICDTDSDFSN
jgi:hypothetical protein